MTSFKIAPGRWVGPDHPCFIIAEIGQNHQGDIEIAKKMIKMAKDNGADCAKFQRADVLKKYNKGARSRPYNSKNSWGKTYGEHKHYIEFSAEQFVELKKYADEVGIIFSSSFGDKEAADGLIGLGVPFLKIASPESTCYDLIEHAASKGIPLVISTGMRSMEEVKTIHKLMTSNNYPFALLQCTSTYPLPPGEVNLNVIKTYMKEFPGIPIGYSGHEEGTAISIAAIAMGAKVLERHVTLDKTWKGNDHAASLLPHELRQLVDQIRMVEQSFGTGVKILRECESGHLEKLSRRVVAARNLSKADIIRKEDIANKVAEPKGICASQAGLIIGKTLTRDVAEDESIFEQYFE